MFKANNNDKNMLFLERGGGDKQAGQNVYSKQINIIIFQQYLAQLSHQIYPSIFHVPWIWVTYAGPSKRSSPGPLFELSIEDAFFHNFPLFFWGGEGGWESNMITLLISAPFPPPWSRGTGPGPN